MPVRSKRTKGSYRGEILITTLGLTNDQAARLLEVSYQSISNWLVRCAMPEKHVDRLSHVVSMAMARANEVRAMCRDKMDLEQVTIPDPTGPEWDELPMDVRERIVDVANVWALVGRRPRAVSVRQVERSMGKTRLDRAFAAVEAAVAELEAVQARHARALAELRHEVAAVT